MKESTRLDRDEAQEARPVALQAFGLRKAYGATIALERADISLKTGEVHALLGENGAGKSTLVRILTGAARADSGEMRILDAPYAPGSILDARKRGVATAFQELSLVPNLSVAHNLHLPRQPKGFAGMNGFRKGEEEAAAILERYGMTRIDPRDVVGELPLAERQRIEIVRAMESASRVLVLDEPTGALAETDWLFDLIRQKTAQGVAVLYISHRLAEVRALGVAATVLRNGRSIATVDLRAADDEDIFEMMVGRRVGERAAARTAPSDRAVRLSVAGLSSKKLKDVSFSLREGEILGVAGLEGQGQAELFRALTGLSARGGTVALDGAAVGPRTPRQALKAGSGIAYLPEERKTEGILAGLSTASNIALPILSRVSHGPVIGAGAEAREARAAGERVELNPRYLGFPIGDLSGGNQQKALIARTLATGARTLLLFDPTRGVDVGTKQSIYAAIRAFAEGGGSVLFYSSELAEIVQLADRCLVLYAGRVNGEFHGGAITEQRLIAAMLGQERAGREDAA